MAYPSFLFPVLVVILGPFCGFLLARIAEEELLPARKYLIPLAWILGAGAFLTLAFLFSDPSLWPVLAVVLFLWGMNFGVLSYEHWWKR